MVAVLGAVRTASRACRGVLPAAARWRRTTQGLVADVEGDGSGWLGRWATIGRCHGDCGGAGPTGRDDGLRGLVRGCARTDTASRVVSGVGSELRDVATAEVDDDDVPGKSETGFRYRIRGTGEKNGEKSRRWAAASSRVHDGS